MYANIQTHKIKKQTIPIFLLPKTQEVFLSRKKEGKLHKKLQLKLEAKTRITGIRTQQGENRP